MGGPDYPVTFGLVKVANPCMFQVLDLDTLVSVFVYVHTNITERATTTLTLQTVSLPRSKMLEELEALICNKYTLDKVCTL